jgi:hypothetical protein
MNVLSWPQAAGNQQQTKHGLKTMTDARNSTLCGTHHTMQSALLAILINATFGIVCICISTDIAFVTQKLWGKKDMFDILFRHRCHPFPLDLIPTGENP